MAYVQKNNPFKKTGGEKKEILSYEEQMRRAGTDPYPKATDSSGFTGFDDRSIVNPRTYDAVEKLYDTIPTSYAGLIRTELMGSEFASDNEKYRKKYAPNIPSTITDYDKAKQAIIDKTNKMDVDQFNSIVTELSDFGSQFKDKNNFQKLTTLLSADLSGMKRVANELGVTKDQIMDLVKAPEGAGIKDRINVKAIKAYLNAKL
tara:strand:- start:1865 stop:2476 length:612 start_codon:yes stop_codon:yes gene_type:complete